MFGKIFERQLPGKVISADRLNKAIAEVERQSKLTAAPPLAIRDAPNGVEIYDASEAPFYVSLTSESSGAYAWTRQVPTAAGTWTDGTQTGTTSRDPAYNTSSGTTLSLPMIVRVERTSLGTLSFTAGDC